MRIFNHASRVVTVKSTAFEDSIGMEKSIEVADDCFDFDRTLEIGYLTLKETKSETEVDFVEGFGKTGKQLALSVERKVEIPITTVVEVKNEDELHIYEKKQAIQSLFNPRITLWSTTCKDAARKPIAAKQYFASERDRAHLRRTEALRATICLPLTVIMLAFSVYESIFDTYSLIQLVAWIITLLLASATIDHIKNARWAKKVKEIAQSISELDI